MILEAQNISSVKHLLIAHLSNIQDGDPSILADYILGILSRSSSLEQARAVCSQKLEEFLGPQTLPFVNKLISDLQRQPSDEKQINSNVLTTELQPNSAPLFPSISHKDEDAIDYEIEEGTMESDYSKSTGHDGSRLSSVVAKTSTTTSRHSKTRQHSPVRLAQNDNSNVESHDEDLREQLKRGNTPGSKGRVSSVSKDKSTRHDRPLRSSRRYEESTDMEIQRNQPRFVAGRNAQRTTSGISSRFPTKNIPKHSGKSSTFSRDSVTDTPLVLVENIPIELCTEEILKDYFGKLGNIRNIHTQTLTKKAAVEFSSNDEAKHAMASTDAILGNRFVTVRYPTFHEAFAFGFPIEKISATGNEASYTSRSPQMPKVVMKPGENVWVNPVANVIASQSPSMSMARPPMSYKLDLRNKTDTETLTEEKKQELENRRMNIQQMQQQLSQRVGTLLQAKYTEEQKADGPNSSRIAELEREYVSVQGQLQQLSSEASTIIQSLSKFSPVVESGTNISTMRLPLVSHQRGRGGKRGAGNVFYRGNQMVSGRGLQPSLRLDLRPTTLVASNLPEEFLHREFLMSHFKSFGEIENFDFQPELKQAAIKYKSRPFAELALKHGTRLNNRILNVHWEQQQCSSGPEVLPQASHISGDVAMGE